MSPPGDIHVLTLLSTDFTRTESQSVTTEEALRRTAHTQFGIKKLEKKNRLQIYSSFMLNVTEGLQLLHRIECCLALLSSSCTKNAEDLVMCLRPCDATSFVPLIERTQSYRRPRVTGLLNSSLHPQANQNLLAVSFSPSVRCHLVLQKKKGTKNQEEKDKNHKLMLKLFC